MRAYKLFEEKKAYIFDKCVVGIDPAKNFIDCAFLNQQNKSICKPKRFKQTQDGFQKLLQFTKRKASVKYIWSFEKIWLN